MKDKNANYFSLTSFDKKTNDAILYYVTHISKADYITHVTEAHAISF